MTRTHRGMKVGMELPITGGGSCRGDGVHLVVTQICVVHCAGGAPRVTRKLAKEALIPTQGGHMECMVPAEDPKAHGVHRGRSSGASGGTIEVHAHDDPITSPPPLDPGDPLPGDGRVPVDSKFMTRHNHDVEMALRASAARAAAAAVEVGRLRVQVEQHRVRFLALRV